MENLENLSKEISIQGTPKIGKENFEAAVKSFRGKWFDDELLRNKYGQTRIVLNQLSPSKHYPGELEFFRGELIRMEKEDNFVTRSIEHYQKAIDLDPQDPRAKREIGLMLMKTDQKARAAENLRAYLDLKPDATDASVIKTFLKQLR
jgi:regulator of sirC expression with transglutaminase-like and TPR domain